MVGIFDSTELFGIMIGSLALLLIVLTSGTGSSVDKSETGF